MSTIWVRCPCGYRYTKTWDHKPCPACGTPDKDTAKVDKPWSVPKPPNDLKGHKED